jgi:hypothetical protein
MTLLMLALAVRLFHHETVASMPTSHNTHVQVAGTVTMVKAEADGDVVHFRVSDSHGRFIVCEIVPYHPLQKPVVGQAVVVYGIRRVDNAGGHGWSEIHPVEKWIEAR